MLTLALLCALFTAILAVMAYITRTVKPRRVKLTAGIWKLVNLSFEADAGGEPKELLLGESSGGEETSGQQARPVTPAPRQPGVNSRV